MLKAISTIWSITAASWMIYKPYSRWKPEQQIHEVFPEAFEFGLASNI